MKKIIVLVVISMLMFAIMPTKAFAAGDIDTWDGTVDTGWYNTTDTEFIINTAEELAGLAQITNGTDPVILKDSFDNKTITLGADINLANKEWTPIGIRIYTPNISSPFLGVLDGANHTISNLDISSTNDYVGLIGYVGDSSYPSATVKNIGIENCNIKGNNGVGGLIGYGDSSIVLGCYVTGGYITGESSVGGLIGFGESAKITNSYVYGSVNSSGSTVGALAGYGEDISIGSSYAAGSVSTNANNAGGLIGRGISAIITNSYYSGTVKGSSNVGSLIGSDEYSNITNSYGNNGNLVIGKGNNGTIYTGGIEGATLEQMVTPEFKDKLNESSSAIEPFAIDSNFNNGYPYLSMIPQIMEGDGQVIKQGETLKFKVTMPYQENETTTRVGGVEVPSTEVVYEVGSTITILSSEYTASLNPGTYSIEIINVDYGTARGTFSVTAETATSEPKPEPTQASVPETGYGINIYVAVAIVMASILGIMVMFRRKWL